MRPLELALVAFVFAAAVVGILYFQKPAPRVLVRSLWIGAAVLACGQIFLEGPRWQMLPAYVSLIALIPLCSTRSTGIRVSSIAALLFCGAASAAGIYMFPVFTLPTPHGPFQVGTFVRHLIDRSRQERHLASPAPREFMIQVWYPAQNEPGVRAWYRDPRMNTFKSSHLRLVKTHSYWNLPVAAGSGPFPVLLFSPSSGGFRNQNTFEVEELASQGYIVVGIDHPYSSSRVVFPDGRIANSVPWIDTASQAAFDESNRRVELMLQDHVADASFVLDELDRWNHQGSGEQLAGRIDLAKVGVFGHSFGGSLAASLCVADPRVLAGINMDGWTFGDALKDGIRKPFFFMYSGDGRGPTRAEVDRLSGAWRVERERDLLDWQGVERSLKRFGGYRMSIVGSDHGDYSDLALFQRPLPFTGRPRFDPYRAFDIVNAYSLAFFDRYLRNRPAPLLDRGNAYPDVLYEDFPAPGITAPATP